MVCDARSVLCTAYPSEAWWWVLITSRVDPSAAIAGPVPCVAGGTRATTVAFLRVHTSHSCQDKRDLIRQGHCRERSPCGRIFFITNCTTYFPREKFKLSIMTTFRFCDCLNKTQGHSTYPICKIAVMHLNPAGRQTEYDFLAGQQKISSTSWQF